MDESSTFCCGLEPRLKGVCACLIDRDFGCSLEIFEVPWCDFPHGLIDRLCEWSPYAAHHQSILALCPEEWQKSTIEHLQRLPHGWTLASIPSTDLRPLLLAGRKLLAGYPLPCRANLLAFIASLGGFYPITSTAELAAAWAHHVTRERLLRLKLTVHNAVVASAGRNSTPTSHPLIRTVAGVHAAVSTASSARIGVAR